MESEDAKLLLLNNSCDNCLYKCLINTVCLRTEYERPISNVCSQWKKGNISEQYDNNMRYPSVKKRLEKIMKLAITGFGKPSSEHTIEEKLIKTITDVQRGLK